MNRMLLSHNCTLPNGTVAPLNRDNFAQVFITGLKAHPDIQCGLIDHPHWIVEICFDPQQKPPTDIAQLCAQRLGDYRAADFAKPLYTVMLLGGLKTTPALSDSPTALQMGQWGVDVVETLTPDEFLAGMNWDNAIADKPADQVFKVTENVTAAMT